MLFELICVIFGRGKSETRCDDTFDPKKGKL